MSDINQFGPWMDAHQLELAMARTLHRWLPSAVGEVERGYELDPGTIKYPLYWTYENVFTKDMEDQLPYGIIVSPGPAEDPRRQGNGAYSAVFRIGVAVVVGASDFISSGRYAKAMAAAVRIAVLQNRRLGDLRQIIRVEWRGERYDDVPETLSERNIAAAQVLFDVEVRDLVNDLQGPLTPTVPPPDPDDPRNPEPNDPGPWPEVRRVSIDVENRGLT